MGVAGELRILLVEDNKDHAILIRSALSEAQAVFHVVTAELAKALLVNNTEAVNFILLDVKLPDCSGIEFLHWLKGDERLSLLPVVMLTTSANPKDIADSYRAGAAGYITKAVGFTALRDKLRVFLKYWQEVSVLPL